MFDDLTPLNATLIKPAARTGALAFENDPTTAYLIPDPKLRSNLYYAFEYYMRMALLTHEEVYLTSSACEGLAVWTTGEHEAGLLVSLRSGWPFLVLRCGLTYMVRDYWVERHFGQLRAKLAPKPYAYLALLAVDPSFQGRGYARKLLTPMLAKLDEEQLPAYLETQSRRNTVMYERFGFKILREEPMPGAGFSLYCMLRPAQREVPL
jgi:ribosomal protein S18 acetylase RimI-like enzyme